MNIQAHQNHITMLKREVQNAWIKACQADNIPLSTSFAVFSNTTEAAAYNELMGIYLKSVQAYRKQLDRNRSRRERHGILTSMGLKRVKGNLGGTYYE